MKTIATAMEGLILPGIEQLLQMPPHDAESLAIFNTERAAEMHRAERRRMPTPQLPLGEGV